MSSISLLFFLSVLSTLLFKNPNIKLGSLIFIFIGASIHIYLCGMYLLAIMQFCIGILISLQGHFIIKEEQVIAREQERKRKNFFPLIIVVPLVAYIVLTLLKKENLIFISEGLVWLHSPIDVLLQGIDTSTLNEMFLVLSIFSISVMYFTFVLVLMLFDKKYLRIKKCEDN
ncbi:MAG: hypothetical protein HQK49_20820 [Oligoflexia bacterium]|nr:hypothetical protein [Oligoflexia bacterium]